MRWGYETSKKLGEIFYRAYMKIRQKFQKILGSPKRAGITEHLNGNPLYYDNSYQLRIIMIIDV